MGPFVADPAEFAPNNKKIVREGDRHRRHHHAPPSALKRNPVDWESVRKRTGKRRGPRGRLGPRVGRVRSSTSDIWARAVEKSRAEAAYRRVVVITTQLLCVCVSGKTAAVSLSLARARARFVTSIAVCGTDGRDEGSETAEECACTSSVVAAAVGQLE